jgi:isopentenyl-diphosphate delta-isomerase
MSEVTPIPQRKVDHIRVNLEEDVQSGLQTGLERFRFRHNALPDLNLGQIDLSTTFLGKRLQAPILISSMTGGTPQAGEINRSLARAAQACGVAMGLGSQRVAFEDPSSVSTFQVRDLAPNILLFANLGAVQLNHGYSVDECRRAVDMASADALILHLNALQEALQPGGDVDFSGLLHRIEAVCHSLGVPVIAKEVGWGISADVARQLVGAGIAAIDVAGAGGTSWSQVEMYRAAESRLARLAYAFRTWGIPTAEAVQSVRRDLPDVPLIASGGLRGGVDIAKCLALGADLGGMAGPFLRAAATSADAVVESIELVQDELRTTLFVTGCPDLAALRHAPLDPVQ